MLKDALFDDSNKYRYMLMRQWGENGENFVNFIMLNPSTADDKIDDRTIESCIRLAKNWGFDGLYATNLFALRATDRNKLKTTDEPVGNENDRYIEQYAKLCKRVVVAWGDWGKLENRGKTVLEKIRKITTPYCLCKTQSGQPGHPLYKKGDTRPIKF